MNRAKDIQLIGNELAVIWDDGVEGYISAPALRAASPSAETAGERDIFGKQYGGEEGGNYAEVEIVDWEHVGNYAVRFHFSDRHSTGLYTWELLRELTVKDDA